MVPIKNHNNAKSSSNYYVIMIVQKILIALNRKPLIFPSFLKQTIVKRLLCDPHSREAT